MKKTLIIFGTWLLSLCSCTPIKSVEEKTVPGTSENQLSQYYLSERSENCDSALEFMDAVIIPDLEHTRFGFAQLTLRYNPTPTLTIENLWQVTATNPAQQTLNTYLEATLTETSKGQFYKARSKTFHLQPGVNVTTLETVQPIQIQETRANARKELPVGTYMLNTKVIDAITGQVLGEVTTRRTKTNSTQTQETQEPSDQLIQFQGRSRTTGQWAARNGDVPAYLESGFLRTELYPSLTVWDLPVSASVLLTTEQQSNRQDLQQFQLQFDVQEYQRILQQKLLKKIAQIKHWHITRQSLAFRVFVSNRQRHSVF